MNNYELLYIIDNTLPEEQREALIAKFVGMVTDAGGSVETIDKWGTKKLAYSINYKTEGYYVLMNFTADAKIPADIEHIMKVSDAILRCMLIKKN